MKILKAAQQMLMCLCILPIENASRWKRFIYISLAFGIILTIVSLIFSSAVFIFQFFSIDLENTFYAFGQLVTIFPTFYSFVIALIKRRKINTLFIKLNKIYRARKCFFSILNE